MHLRRAHPRLLLVVPAFPRLTETFIVSKFLGLLEKGRDIHILCSRSDPGEWENFPALLAQGNVIRRRVHVSWPAQPRWLAALLIPISLLRCLFLAPGASLRYLMPGLKRFGLDVLRRLYLDAELVLLHPDLVHFEFGALARERMYLKLLLGARVTASFRGYDLSYAGLDSPGYYQPVWDGVDGLHLLGMELWQRARTRGCPPGLPHALIPPSVDLTRFNPAHHPDSKLTEFPGRPVRILSVGRTVWVKGYEYALQAVKRLEALGISCHYRIIGVGEMFEGIAFARHQLGLEQSVELMGPQPPAEVSRQMQWADVLLHASVQEGFCNAVLEAQAMGLPVVCSDAGGLPENVEDGVTGFVVPRRDPQALAEKLALLASDPALRERMGRAGRRRVESLFSLSRQLDRFDSFYRGVLENAPRTSPRPYPDVQG